jgi:DNA-binding transcriptional ArsR family regulator
MSSRPDVVFKTLSDPARRALPERLIRDGELSVHVLTSHSGVSQPAVSKHLGVLKVAGLVSDRRDGRATYHSAELVGLAPLYHVSLTPTQAASERLGETCRPPSFI